MHASHWICIRLISLTPRDRPVTRPVIASEFIRNVFLHRKVLLFHIIYTTSINACGLNTLRRACTCQERVCLRMHVHIIACRDSPNGQIQLSVVIAASLHVNHLPPHTHFCPLRLFFCSQNMSSTVFHHHGPFIWSNRCPVIETFIEMKGIIVVNVLTGASHPDVM